MRRLLLTRIVPLVMICTVWVPMFAYANSELDNVNSKLKEVRQEKKESQQKITSTKNQINSIQQNVKATNNQLNDLNTHIDDVTGQLQSLRTNIQKDEEDIKQTAQELQDAETRVQQRTSMLGAKLQIMYQDGNISFLDVLLQSTSVSDFLSRWEYMQQIVKFDKDTLDRNKTDQAIIVQKENQLQQELADVQKNYETEQEQQQTLLATKKDNIVRIASYTKEEQSLADATKSEEADLQELASREESLLAQQKELKALSLSSSPLPPKSSLQDQIRSLLGIPYVWGGTTTDGFDCSGFTGYVLAKYGVHLPRTSAEQSLVGSFVSKDNLRAGDLVFFHTYGPPGEVTHVAIYIGNGEIVNAVSPVVEINRLNDAYFSTRYITARRVLNDAQYKQIIQQ